MGKKDSSHREKYPYLSRESSFERDEEYYSFSDSSYGTSDSARPILRPPIPRKRPVLRPYRFPHTVMRCVCLGVFCALLLFVFALFRVTLIHTFIKPIEIKLPEGELLPRPPQWERFPFLKRYYGGIKTLVPRQNNVPEYPGEEVDEKVKSGKGLPTEDKKKRDSQLSSFIFDPYPHYTSPEYIAKYGSKKDCFLDTAEKVSVPYVRHYNGVPKGFPDAIIGSNELLGIKDDICFDRFGRLGPYGLGYGSRSGGSGAGLEGERSGIESVWEDVPPVDFRGIQWAEVQDRCVSANRHRFPKPSKPRVDSFRTLPLAKRPEGDQKGTETVPANVTIGTDRLPRVAFIIRTWHDFKYNKESIMYLRSLISELSLISGGEYMQQIKGLRVKALVTHSVVNQTRLGKIRKTYVLSVAGNGKGLLGIGEGKSEEPTEARVQSQYRAIRNMQPILRYEDRTIFGDVKGKVGAVELQLMHRPPGKVSSISRSNSWKEKYH
ncbi:hypothetical protein CIHG_10520 [Coccidioides immitis H538.4]|uniref:Small ribosomal subunit protein uS5m n=1 Tax=Coccidioides immitis H538.4 TaxID=396776 RepID=A0A0P6Q387_COCIT|nr:hypothetical protein CIHG_10520 [Coccidioides immitis H538.4]